jgi:hypothetical protein
MHKESNGGIDDTGGINLEGETARKNEKRRKGSDDNERPGAYFPAAAFCT